MYRVTVVPKKKNFCITHRWKRRGKKSTIHTTYSDCVCCKGRKVEQYTIGYQPIDWSWLNRIAQKEKKMKDPVRSFLTELLDGILIGIDELRFIVWNPQFWAGTITFMALVAVIAMDGCMRRGV